MIKQSIIGLLLTLGLQLNAQLGSTPLLGAKSLSMGNTGAASTGIQSIYFGQAGLTSIDKVSIQLSTEQRFTLSDLSIASAALAFRPGRIGVIGLFISNYGLKEYREQKYGLSYAKQISENISVGAQWSLNTIRISEYGSTSYVGIDIGAKTKLSEQLSAGLHISNPIKNNIAYNESTHRLLNIGVFYKISDKVELMSDYRLIGDIAKSFHFGLDYNMIEAVNFRIGIDTGISSFHFGIAYNINTESIVEAGFSNHQYLGITPALSLSYEK